MMELYCPSLLAVDAGEATAVERTRGAYVAPLGELRDRDRSPHGPRLACEARYGVREPGPRRGIAHHRCAASSGRDRGGIGARELLRDDAVDVASYDRVDERSGTETVAFRPATLAGFRRSLHSPSRKSLAGGPAIQVGLVVGSVPSGPHWI